MEKHEQKDNVYKIFTPEPLFICHQILINMAIKYLFHFVCNSISVQSFLLLLRCDFFRLLFSSFHFRLSLAVPPSVTLFTIVLILYTFSKEKEKNNNIHNNKKPLYFRISFLFCMYVCMYVRETPNELTNFQSINLNWPNSKE